MLFESLTLGWNKRVPGLNLRETIARKITLATDSGLSSLIGHNSTFFLVSHVRTGHGGLCKAKTQKERGRLRGGDKIKFAFMQWYERIVSEKECEHVEV